MGSLVKIVIIYLLRILMRPLMFFPLKENRVIINAYTGHQYACNPRYISEFLVNNHKDEFEIIWAFRKPKEYMFLEKKGIKVIRYSSLKRFYYEATAKFSINNIGSFSYLPLRKGQQHINTWHSGFDMTGCALTEPRNNRIMCKTLKMSSNETTLFLSSNRWFSDFALEKEFDYSGEILNYGLPRSDDLVNEKRDVLNKRMRSFLGVREDTIIFLYGPTWRYGGVKDNPHIDLAGVCRILEEKYGENYLVLKRSHHLAKESIQENEHIKDMTDYPNVEEIIPAVNIFISDYSSLIWDASLVHSYVILFVPDIEKYSVERTMYKPIQEWGYPVAITDDELYECLKNVDLDEGKKRAEEFLEMYGNYETGKSVSYFYEWMKTK